MIGEKQRLKEMDNIQLSKCLALFLNFEKVAFSNLSQVLSQKPLTLILENRISLTVQILNAYSSQMPVTILLNNNSTIFKLRGVILILCKKNNCQKKHFLLEMPLKLYKRLKTTSISLMRRLFSQKNIFSELAMILSNPIKNWWKISNLNSNVLFGIHMPG